MYPHQAERLTAVLEREGLEALVATAPENIAYVTGFRSLSQALYRRTPFFAVFARRGTALVVPMIDVPTVAAGAPDVDHVVTWGDFFVDYADSRGDAERRAREWSARPSATAADALADALAALEVRRGPIGLDDSSLAFDAWHRASERLAPMKVVAAGSGFAEARSIKGPYEIDCIARALGVAEEAANAVIQMLAPGTTEHEAARLYEETVVKRGGEPYATIVAIGDRSAIPASFPSERALRARELVRLEVGCLFKGYAASVARTAVMGQPDDRQERTYASIQQGVDAAIDAVRAGTTAGRIFDVATAAVRDAGVPEYRRHHVGHGIGLEAYEPPVLSHGNDAELADHMVLVVETPYYRLGWGGVTVKETVLVTRAGAQVLNRSSRGLVVLD